MDIEAVEQVVGGAQSLRRALSLLRLLGRHHDAGLRLHDLIRHSGLERSTAHRLLRCLGEEGFAEQDPATRRWRLGIEAMHLGFACLRHAPIIDRHIALLRSLARQSGDTVFLLVRDADDCLCLHREEGHFPVKVFTIDAGGRRLLGLGAGGLALLAAQDDAQIDDLLARRAADYRKAGIEPASLRRAIARTRRLGWAEISETITPGVSGVGVAFSVSPTLRAAISFGAITARMGPARRAELAALLIDGLRPPS